MSTNGKLRHRGNLDAGRTRGATRARYGSHEHWHAWGPRAGLVETAEFEEQIAAQAGGRLYPLSHGSDCLRHDEHEASWTKRHRDHDP
jgi:hypothetical protein